MFYTRNFFLFIYFFFSDKHYACSLSYQAYFKGMDRKRRPSWMNVSSILTFYIRKARRWVESSETEKWHWQTLGCVWSSDAKTWSKFHALLQPLLCNMGRCKITSLSNNKYWGFEKHIKIGQTNFYLSHNNFNMLARPSTYANEIWYISSITDI